MGPIELQLCRELAIHLVRACAQFDDVADEAADDLPALRAQLERWTAQWLSLSRFELDGLTAEQAIAAERLNAGRSPSGQLQEPVLRVELYTNLPDVESWPATDELDDELASPVASDFSLQAAEIERMLDLFDGLNPRRLTDDLSGIPAEEMALEAPLDEQRWQAFYQRYLHDWLTND